MNAENVFVSAAFAEKHKIACFQFNNGACININRSGEVRR